MNGIPSIYGSRSASEDVSASIFLGNIYVPGATDLYWSPVSSMVDHITSALLSLHQEALANASIYVVGATLKNISKRSRNTGGTGMK